MLMFVSGSIIIEFGARKFAIALDDGILVLHSGTLASEGGFDDLREGNAYFRTLAAATH